MAVEASLVLPLVLLVLVSCLSIISIFNSHLNIQASLSQATARSSVRSSLNETYGTGTVWISYYNGLEKEADKGFLYKFRESKGFDVDYKHLITKDAFKSSFFMKDLLIANRVRTKKWNGDKEAGEGSREEYVYVTRTGKVYHASMNCTYLKPSTRATSSSKIDEIRNESGGRYHKCDICLNKASSAGFVYVTDYGTAFHRISNCRGLKRDIKRVPLSQASHLRGCSKCYQ